MDDVITKTPGAAPIDPMAAVTPAAGMPAEPAAPAMGEAPAEPATGEETPAVPADGIPVVEKSIPAPMGVPGSEPAEDPIKPAI